MQISEALHNPSFIDKTTNYDGILRNLKKDRRLVKENSKNNLPNWFLELN